MYYTELDPFTKKKIFVEKDQRRKEKQKEIVVPRTNHHNMRAKRMTSSGMQG